MDNNLEVENLEFNPKKHKINIIDETMDKDTLKEIMRKRLNNASSVRFTLEEVIQREDIFKGEN